MIVGKFDPEFRLRLCEKIKQFCASHLTKFVTDLSGIWYVHIPFYSSDSQSMERALLGRFLKLGVASIWTFTNRLLPK